MAHIAHILVYPIKSLDGLMVDSLRFNAIGSLAGDREFRIVPVDPGHKSSKLGVIGKNSAPRIAQLRAHYDFKSGQRVVTFNHSNSFDLDHEQSAINGFLSEFLGFPVLLQQDESLGYSDQEIYPCPPDETKIRGPLIVSRESLIQVGDWGQSENIDLGTYDHLIRRFRPNIVLQDDTKEPFWEDGLVAANDVAFVPKRFQLGSTPMISRKLCHRCQVPGLHPDTGESIKSFRRFFSQYRSKSLDANHPGLADRKFNGSARKNGLYWFGLFADCAQPDPEQAIIRIGDQLSLS